MTPSKPREWWLCIEMECEDGESEGYAYTGKSPMNSDDVRVIEQAAYTALLAEAEALYAELDMRNDNAPTGRTVAALARFDEFKRRMG